MARYIIGRLVSLVFVLFMVSLIAFFLMHAVPGGPFDLGGYKVNFAPRSNEGSSYVEISVIGSNGRILN